MAQTVVLHYFCTRLHIFSWGGGCGGYTAARNTKGYRQVYYRWVAVDVDLPSTLPYADRLTASAYSERTVIDKKEARILVMRLGDANLTLELYNFTKSDEG